MSSIKLDPCQIVPEPVDHVDHLPDPLILLIFNRIGDVKSLGRCSAVSKRFNSLITQVENVVVRVDCVISDEDQSPSSSSSSNTAFSNSSLSYKSRLKYIVSSFVKPFQLFNQFISNKRSGSGVDDEEIDRSSVTHHSPTQVLRNFEEIKVLRIELPAGELGIESEVLLKWRADFGSTLDNCVILGAASVLKDGGIHGRNEVNENVSGEGDNGSIPESFYTNGGLKLRVVWTISSLIAASARHYLLQSIIAEHKTLSSLVLSDADGQGVLCMDKEQLEELRVKPLSASSASKRTLVPALNMRLWYAAHLDLPDGTVLKGATLVAIRPSEQRKKDVGGGDGNWVASAFEEPYLTAAKMLVKRRTYCLEMNSF